MWRVSWNWRNTDCIILVDEELWDWLWLPLSFCFQHVLIQISVARVNGIHSSTKLQPWMVMPCAVNLDFVGNGYFHQQRAPVIDLYDIWYSEYQLSCMYYMISYDRFGMSISKQRPNRRLKLYASRSIWCWLENLAKALNMSKTFSELTQMLLIKYSRGKL